MKVKGPEVLREADRVAIANPRYAPYGRVALEFQKWAFTRMEGWKLAQNNVAHASVCRMEVLRSE
ncbi:MAG: hypothetical protein Q9N34_09105 [Aquificota bacterium]|nr:hypothetical protein [Aquificota bacterium]